MLEISLCEFLSLLAAEALRRGSPALRLIFFELFNRAPYFTDKPDTMQQLANYAELEVPKDIIDDIQVPTASSPNPLPLRPPAGLATWMDRARILDLLNQRAGEWGRGGARLVNRDLRITNLGNLPRERGSGRLIRRLLLEAIIEVSHPEIVHHRR